MTEEWTGGEYHEDIEGGGPAYRWTDSAGNVLLTNTPNPPSSPAGLPAGTPIAPPVGGGQYYDPSMQAWITLQPGGGVVISQDRPTEPIPAVEMIDPAKPSDSPDRDAWPMTPPWMFQSKEAGGEQWQGGEYHEDVQGGGPAYRWTDSAGNVLLTNTPNPPSSPAGLPAGTPIAPPVGGGQYYDPSMQAWITLQPGGGVVISQDRPTEPIPAVEMIDPAKPSDSPDRDAWPMTPPWMFQSKEAGGEQWQGGEYHEDVQGGGPAYRWTDSAGNVLLTKDPNPPSSPAGLPAGTPMPRGTITLSTGEVVDAITFKELPIEQQYRLYENGIDAYNEWVESTTITLPNGDRISKDAFNDLTPEQQQKLQEVGIDAYYVYSVAGQAGVDYLALLPSITDEQRQSIVIPETITAFTDNPYPQGTKEYYLFDIQKSGEMDLGEAIQSIGGSYEEYSALITPEEKQSYIDAKVKEYEASQVNLGWQPSDIKGGWEYDITGGEFGEMAERYASGDISDEQWLNYVKGAKARASVTAIPPSPIAIQKLMVSAVDVGGDINYYNSLKTPQEKVEYYNEIVDKKFIKDVDGDLDYYNSLATPELRNDYIQQLQNEQIAKYEQFVANANTVQRYIDNGKITVNEDGTYDFSKLSAFDVERDEDLKTALNSFFPTDAEGNEFDIINALTNAIPSYLSSADDMTDTMKQLVYNDGLQAVSLWGKTPEEKFEAMQSWGLIPIGAKYIGGTDRYIPTQEDLDSMGITIEQYKQLTMDTGGDWIYGMPVWSLPEGRLSPETVNYFKTLDWDTLKGRTGQVSIPALQTILTERYSGKDWNELTEGQKQNALELYYQPGILAQMEGGYAEAHEWIAGEPIPEGQMYVGITPYNPPDPTTGIAGAQASVTNWAKTEENVGIKVFKSVAAGIASLGLGVAGMLQTAYGAGQQLGAGNFVQAGKDLIGIPLGMSEFIMLQLPKDIIADPAYGVGEIVGMFVLPEIAKSGFHTVKASFRTIDPRLASSSIYSTNPNIRFYRGSPYMTAVEFRNAFQGLQSKQRITPETRAISEVITTKIPENITEAKFTKVGNEYVIDGTKVDASGNLIEVREPRYHPSANTIDDVGTLRDTAKIVLYHTLPDGTKEYLVVKDRAGGAYQLPGGGLELKAGSALTQVLRELFEETNLKAKGVIELQPYLGKMHSHAYNGTRIFMGEVIDKVAFDRFLHAHEGIPEVKSAVWIKDSGMPKVQVGVMPATYDVLTGVGVPKNALKIVGVDKITDTARDLTWGERIGERKGKGFEPMSIEQENSLNKRIQNLQEIVDLEQSTPKDFFELRAKSRARGLPLWEEGGKIVGLDGRVWDSVAEAWTSIKEMPTAASKELIIAKQLKDGNEALKTSKERMPTEVEIKAASLKEPAIIDGQLKTMLVKTLTPANMSRPVRLWHFTHDYSDLMSKAQNGVITLTDANKKYNSFYTSPEPASFYSYRNISKGFPDKHRPALLAIDVMPSELIKAGYELSWVKDGVTGQYVWKIANHVIEDEITLAQGAKLKTYTPNWISKTISKGDFKDFTATSLTDNPGVTAKINLQPKLVEFTGKLPEIKASNIKKIVIDLDDTLVNVRTMKLIPGAIELLDALKSRGKILTLWTHSPKVRVQEIFKRNPELNKYFDINNKNSVITRENYTKSTDADVFKNIKAIKGDILIDNSPNQIYQQLQRGNVGLQAVDLYSIKSMLIRDDVIQSSKVSKEVPQYTTYKQGQKIPVLYLQTEAYKMATETVAKAVDKLSANKLYIEELSKQISERKRQGLSTEKLEAELKRILDTDVEAIKHIIELNKLGIKDIPTTVGELYQLKGLAFREKLYDILGGKIRPKPIKLAWHGSADSPLKNVSTSLKTTVEGLEKYGKKEGATKEGILKTKDGASRPGITDLYKRERVRSEEPYKVGIDEPLASLTVSGREDVNDLASYDMEMETLKREEVGAIEEYDIEPSLARESTLEEARLPEETLTEVNIPEEVATEGIISESTLPEVGLTEGISPESRMAEGTIPESIIVEGTIPEAILPEDIIPEGAIPEQLPPEEFIPIKLFDIAGTKLTQEEREGAVAWRQGIMYKLIYPPYGQEHIINSRKPFPNMKIHTGAESAFKTLVQRGKGKLPKTIKRDMGIMDIHITTGGGKGKKPKMKFKLDRYQQTDITPRITRM